MAVTKREQLAAKIKAMPSGMLIQSIDQLGNKQDRDAAENLVLTGMNAEYRHRLYQLAQNTTTEALLKDFRDITREDYATLRPTRNLLYWVIDDELQRRYPKAAAATDAWLLANDGSNLASNSYGTQFLTNIQETKA